MGGGFQVFFLSTHKMYGSVFFELHTTRSVAANMPSTKFTQDLP